MRNKFILVIILILSFLLIIATGCSKNKPFVIPVNYSGEAVVKSYADKSENTYDVKIICRDGNYSFNIDNENINWNVSINGDSCVLYNEKFDDGTVTIDNFKLKDTIVSEMDLNKFNNYEENIPEELIYWDGTYKHVLNFSKESLLPEKIFIYKNENLVKSIEYKKLEMKE